MSKKEIRFSILNEEADPVEFEVSPSEKERIFAMSRAKYEAKKNDFTNNTVDEVSGVEVYHRPKWYRAVCAAAAVMIVAAGIGGSAFMVKTVQDSSFRPATSIETEQSGEPDAENPDEEAVAAVSYDLSTKEGIYLKMLNSIDSFDKVSGRLIYQIPYDTECDMMDFSINLDTAESYTKHTFVNLHNLGDVLSGMPADYQLRQDTDRANGFIMYSDGVASYRIDGNVKDADGYSPPCERNRTPIQAQDIAAVTEWFHSHDERDERAKEIYNRTALYRDSEMNQLVTDCDSQMVAAYYLTVFDRWDVTGEERFLDRDCLVIEGMIDPEMYLFAKVEGINTFTVYVDKETGSVLNFIGYNEAGEISTFCVYQEIHFDDDAEMVTLDLDAYETLEHPPVSQNRRYVNSKGEVYGNLGSYTWEDVDEIPDLVEIGFDGGRKIGYIRKDEFTSLFVDCGKAFDMQPELENVSETAVAVEVNVYDQEGEYIFTQTFYTEPENLLNYPVNSKGETYGMVQYDLVEENIDKLPDLISFGYDFLRTKEYLAIFIDGAEAMHMQAEKDNVSETAVAVEVNIYDQEGEFLYTRTFYTEPENLK